MWIDEVGPVATKQAKWFKRKRRKNNSTGVRPALYPKRLGKENICEVKIKKVQGERIHSQKVENQNQEAREVVERYLKK